MLTASTYRHFIFSGLTHLRRVLRCLLSKPLSFFSTFWAFSATMMGDFAFFTLPLSFLLSPSFHAIENCFSSAFRCFAINMAVSSFTQTCFHTKEFPDYFIKIRFACRKRLTRCSAKRRIQFFSTATLVRDYYVVWFPPAQFRVQRWTSLMCARACVFLSRRETIQNDNFIYQCKCSILKQSYPIVTNDKSYQILLIHLCVWFSDMFQNAHLLKPWVGMIRSQ